VRPLLCGVGDDVVDANCDSLDDNEQALNEMEVKVKYLRQDYNIYYYKARSFHRFFGASTRIQWSAELGGCFYHQVSMRLFHKELPLRGF
jgi:hypothetical protein